MPNKQRIKSIKAVLVNRGIAYSKIHIIERLIDLLPEDVSKIPELSQSVKLSVYATVSRYPGDVSESSDQPAQLGPNPSFSSAYICG